MDKTLTLHPKIRKEVLEGVAHVNTNILTGTVKMLVTCGIRTFSEQTSLYNKKPKVTNAKAGQSIHNYGLAFDFCLKDINTGQPVWETNKDYDGDKNPDWMEIVAYFKGIGYKWGGDFKSINDKPHMEKTFNHTWQSLLELYQLKKVDKDGYVII